MKKINFRPIKINYLPRDIDTGNYFENFLVSSVSSVITLRLFLYLAKQPISQGVAQNKNTIELGQSIYRGGIAAKGVPACAACHSPTGAGIPAQYPLLGGQWADYTNSQLLAFREGVRKNSGQMTAMATKLSEQ